MLRNSSSKPFGDIKFRVWVRMLIAMLQALSPDLLAHILQLALGPEECCVGGGRHALCVPIRLGADCRGLSALRRACKAFRGVLSEVPLHITASTTRQLRSLAKLSCKWNVAAVQLRLSADEMPPGLTAYAAYKLPDRVRQKIVTVDMQGMSIHLYDDLLRHRQLEGVCQLIIHTVDNANDLHYLERLPHIQRLDVWDLSIRSLEMLVYCCCPCMLRPLSSAVHQSAGMQLYKPACVAHAGAAAQAT